MWHLTCTQHTTCRDSCDLDFWLLLGCHWVPSVHASVNVYINVIPTSFVSRLRRSSLPIGYLQCDCRVQVSVRLLKMLRRIVCKVKIFLAIAMLVTSSWSDALPWLFEFFQYSTPKIFPSASLFDDSGLTTSDAATPLSGTQGEEINASSSPWAWRRHCHEPNLAQLGVTLPKLLPYSQPITLC